MRLLGPEDADPGVMSLTRTVPADVPSLFHSSLPAESPATKKRVFPTAVRDTGELPPVPATMSLTRTVPAVVPLLLHNSAPAAWVLARKKRVLPTTVKELMLELTLASGILTRAVPAVVPSVFHRAEGTRELSAAEKYSALPRAVKLLGFALLEPGLMSLTSTVPASVPSVFHSSVPRLA